MSRRRKGVREPLRVEWLGGSRASEDRKKLQELEEELEGLKVGVCVVCVYVWVCVGVCGGVHVCLCC